MQKLALDPEALTNAAHCAHKVGRPDAAERLADLVESMGHTPVMDGIGDAEPDPGQYKGAFA